MDELVVTLEHKIGSIIQKYTDAMKEIENKDREINELKSSLSTSEEKQNEIKARLEGIIHKLENI